MENDSIIITDNKNKPGRGLDIYCQKGHRILKAFTTLFISSFCYYFIQSVTPGINLATLTNEEPCFEKPHKKRL
jgi:hypothetical protein